MGIPGREDGENKGPEMEAYLSRKLVQEYWDGYWSYVNEVREVGPEVREWQINGFLAILWTLVFALIETGPMAEFWTEGWYELP